MPATTRPLSEKALIQKRQRYATDNDQLHYPRAKAHKIGHSGRSQSPVLFLPTHLVILQALYADGDRTGEEVSNPCPNPRWAEVNRFVQLQASIAYRASQSRRISGLLRALGGVSPETLPQSSRSSAAMGSRGMIPQQNLPTLQRTCDDQISGVRTEGSTSYTTPCSPASAKALLPNQSILESFTLDPRSVVCTVLRRAVRDRSDKYNSVVSEELRNGVDQTVENLASSMERLMRQQVGEREMPWRVRGASLDELNAAEVIERQANKLLLWRRLQSALSAYRKMTEEYFSDIMKDFPDVQCYSPKAALNLVLRYEAQVIQRSNKSGYLERGLSARFQSEGYEQNWNRWKSWPCKHGTNSPMEATTRETITPTVYRPTVDAFGI